ncbi:MAG: DUF2950 domain-containing protein [Smithella sp.]
MKVKTSHSISGFLLPLLVIFFIFAAGLPLLAATSVKGQQSFSSAEDAASALAAAVKSGNKSEIITILGPGSTKIVSSGDEVADKEGLERFNRLYEEKHLIESAAGNKSILVLGNDDFPFPVPLVKKENKWHFDARAGRDEILNRRIGRNELEVINVMLTYVDAQREYASKDRDSDAVLEFAQKFRSTPGKKDGLYWEAKDGVEMSPLGSFVAKADSEGYAKSKGGDNSPYWGYLFKILKAQGKYAEGGAFDYVVNGRMILGFALVAYPVEYGNSGIMTFVVNQNGVVHQKDMGRNTGKIAAAMKSYNPDNTWKKVE